MNSELIVHQRWCQARRQTFVYMYIYIQERDSGSWNSADARARGLTRDIIDMVKRCVLPRHVKCDRRRASVHDVYDDEFRVCALRFRLIQTGRHPCSTTSLLVMKGTAAMPADPRHLWRAHENSYRRIGEQWILLGFDGKCKINSIVELDIKKSMSNLCLKLWHFSIWYIRGANIVNIEAKNSCARIGEQWILLKLSGINLIRYKKGYIEFMWLWTSRKRIGE